MWRQEHAITQHRLINIGNPPIFGAPPLTRPEVADLVPQRDALEHLGNHLIVDFVTGYFPIHGSIDDVPEKLRTDRDTVERWEGARDSYDWRTSREVLETPEGIEYGLAVFTKPESNTTMGWMRMNPAAHLRRLGEPTEGVHRAPALIAKVFHDLHKHLRPRGGIASLTLSRVDLAVDYRLTAPAAPFIDAIRRSVQGTGVSARLYLNKSPHAPLGFSTRQAQAGHLTVQDIRFNPTRGSHDPARPLRVEVRARRKRGKGWLDHAEVEGLEDLVPSILASFFADGNMFPVS